MVGNRNIFESDEGVNVVMEYILVFIIASFVFIVLLMSSQSIFVEGPSKIVAKNQFMDIGNDVSAKLIDTYLVAPDPYDKSVEGSIATSFDMPYDIAGYGYNTQISDSPSGDKEVYVYSDQYPDVSVKLTLNGVSSTVGIVGSTSSHNAEHWISYKKT